MVWPKLWSLALNGAFVRIISYPSHSSKACHIRSIDCLDSSILAHILSAHIDASYGVSDIDPLQASASITSSNSNTQDSDHDTSCLEATDFSRYISMIYPLSTMFSH